jgi:hypothetical protein
MASASNSTITTVPKDHGHACAQQCREKLTTSLFKVLAGDAEFIKETQTWRRLVPLPKLGELLEATNSVDAPTFFELVML